VAIGAPPEVAGDQREASEKTLPFPSGEITIRIDGGATD
jgi:hypothetical protein